MTENETGYAPPPPGFTAPPPPPPAPPRPPLRRTTGDANVLGGVAAGIARSLGIDPILVRVAFVVLTVFGGSGVLLYIVGWLFIPEDGRADSAGERFFRDNNALAIAAAVIVGVIVVGPMLAWGLWGDGPGFGGLLLLFLVIAAVVALTRRGTGSAGAPTSPPAAAPAATPIAQGTQPTQVLPTSTWGTEPPPPPASTTALPPVPPPPPAPRERSVLGRLTVGVTLLVAGTLIALDVADVIAVGAVTVLASALAVVSVGLLVGAWVGRSRGLIALGVVLVLALIPLGALPDDIRWNAGSGAGERVYRVTSQEDLRSEYELGAGELTLDLRRLDLTEPAEVDVSVGVGELIVVLPDDLAVSATADVAVGAIEMPGERAVEGVDVSSSWDRAADADTNADTDTVTTGNLDLTLSTGLGQVTVIDESLEVSR